MTRRREFLILLSLFAASFVVRLVFAAQLVFPPLDDPAFYIQTARHMAAGRGLVSDVLWNYITQFASVTHPSHEYWMPLATWLMVPFLRWESTATWAAQLPGVICGALLVPITYVLARLVCPAGRDRVWAVLAAVLVTFGALPVYQAASADSSAPFAVCASVALIAGGLASVRRAPRWAIAAGVMSGLAYLARSDGLLIPVCIALWLVVSIHPLRAAVPVLLALLAPIAVIVLAWWLRNLTVFGAVQPVSPGPLIFLQDYGQLFNWQNPPTLGGLMARGLPFVLDLRQQALQHNLEVWLIMSFPYGILGVPALLVARSGFMRLGLIYAATLFLVTALAFAVPTLMGLFYHSAAATLPWLAVGSVLAVRWLVKRWRPIGVVVYAVTIALIVFQCAVAWPAVIADSRANLQRFDAVSTWLRANIPADEPLVTNEAHSLNYASGFSTLTLPNQQDVITLRSLAERYGARIVVVFGSIGLYPRALDQSQARAHLMAELPGAWIYELER